MASPSWWAWVWVNSRSWWWTGRPGVLWFMGSQRVGHNWAIELNWIVYVQSLSCIWLFVTTWTVACQAPLSMGLFRQEYKSRLQLPPQGDLPNPGIKLASPALAGGFFTTEPLESPTQQLLLSKCWEALNNTYKMQSRIDTTRHKRPHIMWCQEYAMSRRWKSIEKESRFLIARGCVCWYEHFLELDSGDGCTALNILKTI